METEYLSIVDTISKIGVLGAILYFPLLVMLTGKSNLTLGLAFFVLSIAWLTLNSVYFRVASRSYVFNT